MFTNIKLLLLSLTLLIGLMLTQCGKNKITQLTNQQPYFTLIGQWQWVSSVGGIGGWTRTPETEGYDVILSFNTDSTFSRTKIDSTGTIISEGTYYIKYEEIDFPSPNNTRYVIYMNSTRSRLDIDSNDLSISDLHVDGFGHRYVRITE